ncbi:MAG: hypothetical protein B6244_06900 [Candidatus Cloacimonetes bacterium 4572_55]|nr:MAG: hypothetical protein B6244_06900 [Candidatus Cloacimonetes bacterium 4572_55]
MAHNRLKFITLFLLLFLSCGQQKSPPGGPPDVIPPKIMDIFPLDREEKVPLDSEIHLIFSEIVDHSGAEKLVRLFPSTLYQTDWDGEILKLKPKEPLEPDYVYDLYFFGNIKDRDGNRTDERRHCIFTTADSLPIGEIEGTVSHLKEDTAKAVIELYLLNPMHRDSIPAKPMRAATGDKQGQFIFSHLYTPGVYHLRAYIDKNSDWKRQPSSEPLAETEQPLYLIESRPRSSVRLHTLLPGDPGAVAGSIEKPDSLSAYPFLVRTIRLAEPPDTLIQKIQEQSDYTLYDLPAGNYLVTGIVDRDRDGRGAEDYDYSSVYPDTVIVISGKKTKSVNLIFKKF